MWSEREGGRLRETRRENGHRVRKREGGQVKGNKKGELACSEKERGG